MQGLQEPAEDAGLFGKLKQAANRVKYTVAGAEGWAMYSTQHRQRAACRSRGRQIPAGLATPQVRTGADDRSGRWPGARRRLRVFDPLHAHRRDTGKLHRPGRSRCRRIAGRRRLQGDGTARITGSAALSPTTTASTSFIFAALFPEHRDGEVSKSAELAREMGYLRQSDASC